mmetsp:Transcript_66213/g.166976  ORF Transcript_66213/g.166976 Transcript_66213/m.166976 type:complete len:284 (-) Transcript_66213:653-1504(-)
MVGPMARARIRRSLNSDGRENLLAQVLRRFSSSLACRTADANGKHRKCCRGRCWRRSWRWIGGHLGLRRGVGLLTRRAPCRRTGEVLYGLQQLCRRPPLRGRHLVQIVHRPLVPPQRLAELRHAVLREDVVHARLVGEGLADALHGFSREAAHLHLDVLPVRVPVGDRPLDDPDPARHLEEQDARAPHVCAHAVVLLVGDLWSHEGEGPGFELAAAAGALHGGGVEVHQLDPQLVSVVRSSKRNVLWLDVSVTDPRSAVQVVDHIRQLRDQRAQLRRRESLLP